MNEYIVLASVKEWPGISDGLVLLENKQDEASRFLYEQLIDKLIDGDFVLTVAAERVASVVKRAWV